GSAAVRAQLRLQLADHLRAGRPQAAAGRDEDGPHHLVGQLGAQPRQPGPDPGGALGPAVLGRDAVRRGQLPQGGRRRAA
ncbi:hypothetical protein DF186_23990, partial [Enterococcus hirae]